MRREVRNHLRNTVAQCRRLLEEAIGEQLQGRYGVHPDGKVEDAARMGHLPADEQRARQELVDALRHIEATGIPPAEAVRRLVREVAFTHLNRLVAFKMMEDPSRRIIREAVGRGQQSNGFKFYLADHPDDEALWRSGQGDVAYRHFLEWLGRSFANEIGALFSEADPANRLFPPQRVLDRVLSLLNDEKLADAWQEDETIGWVYQYFTPKELRDRARKESPAPRNAYELAFRNQFYTPRYVVRFLVDNTLGRIWYEMREGKTALVDVCAYMLRPPEASASSPSPPDAAGESKTDAGGLPAAGQRRKKDPRDIRVIDPACGSGHFLLYAFDLLERIYREGWEDPEAPAFSASGKTLREELPDPTAFAAEVPGLILRYNLHGIDIDARSVQIAALALWLRAQRAFQAMGLNRDRRPRIERSNIVVAESMPGERDFFTEFVATLSPPLRPLLREVFGRMRRADEVGSLLCIEDEIREVVDTAYRQWRERPRQAPLPALAATSEQMPLELWEVEQETFWQEAEALLLEALEAYAQRVMNGRGYARRLFAQDTARGFAFVDVCRRTFDVVLMNPPFGDGTPAVNAYMGERFPRSKQDIACAFVDRWFARLNPGGKLGVIMTRTPFFLSSSTRWRDELILGEEGGLEVFADLGHGVLEAMVETAALTLGREKDARASATFLRVVQEPEEAKAQALADVLCNPGNGRRFVVELSSFRQVPNSPLAYWVTDRVRQLFQELPSFEGDGRTVKQGLATADDFRFVRAWWEVPPESIVTGSGSETPEDFVRQTFEGKRWAPFAKGGEYSPYYADIALVVNWERDGEEIRQFVDEKTGRPHSRPQNTRFYFRPGLTWPLRARAFCPQVLPAGTIFSVRGYAVLAPPSDLPALLGLGSSITFDYIFKVLLGRSEFPEFVVGVLKRIPVPAELSDRAGALGDLAIETYCQYRRLRIGFEGSREFLIPCLLTWGPLSLLEGLSRWEITVGEICNAVAQVEKEIDDMVLELYGLSPSDLGGATRQGGGTTSCPDGDDGKVPSWPNQAVGVHEDAEPPSLVADVLSWCVGVIFGRFDFRVAIEDHQKGYRPPFTPLPSRSPGMLPEEAPPPGYPITVSPHGILVDDDAGPTEDVVSRVHGVLEQLWGDRAEAVEREACEILGVADLRSYFRDPKGFFAHHVKRYSRSGRKAPIYWLLQSPRRHFSLWLYYHRLDPDTLFKVVTLYLEPKIRLEDDRLERLRSRQKEVGNSGRVAREIARQVEHQENVLMDLREFRDRLHRAAELGLRPDRHDGVILNMAPLWELVPWKEPKRYWDALLRGEYEWSSIARQLRERGLVRT